MTVETQQEKQVINSIMRWILFGVSIVVLPPIFDTLFRIIVGYSVDYRKCLPDMLLAVLSVSCNLMNTCFDEQKSIKHLLRWFAGFILGTVVAFCWGFFFIIKFEFFQITDEILKIMFVSGFIIIVICAVSGCIIEWKSNKGGD